MSTRQNGHGQLEGEWLILLDTMVFSTLMILFGMLYAFVPACGGEVKGRSAAEPAKAVDSRVELSSTPQASPSPAYVQQEAALIETTCEPMEHKPSPMVEPGDFSAVFPAFETGTDALLSHQSETLRVSVERVQENGVTYFVADVWVRNIKIFQTAFAKNGFGQGIIQMPVEMARANDAILAVTGDYYGVRDVGTVIRNGELYRDSMSTDVCVLQTDGVMRVYQETEIFSLERIARDAYQAWSFGPQLVKDGSVADTSHSRIRRKNPRCAIGYYVPGHYCLLVADGRQEGYSNGLTLEELAKIMAELGCKEAYNLDGGATAAMIFQGKLVNRPVNGGRRCSDILCFSEGA
ncbi:MAG: phosphodiester glycosidase family protein [Clostridia bacterium]